MGVAKRMGEKVFMVLFSYANSICKSGRGACC